MTGWPVHTEVVEKLATSLIHRYLLLVQCPFATAPRMTDLPPSPQRRFGLLTEPHLPSNAHIAIVLDEA